MYYTYVLKSLKDFKHYTGYTENVQKRLIEHNNGLCKSTRQRRPFILEYFEEFQNKSDAIKRERFLKSGQGREFLKGILN